VLPSEFVVSGAGIPDVNFDVGESYAGLLPVSSDPDDPNKLYFWFFPSTNPAAKKEIIIWLNGGVSTSGTQHDDLRLLATELTRLSAWMFLARGFSPGERPFPMAIRNVQAREEPLELAYPYQHDMG
jgi:hypothetical protein